MRNQFDKILNWYFSKSALPYWCIILIDCASMMASGVLTYWLFTNTQTLYDDTLRVFNTMVCFTILSVPGFRLFHTYAGYMRFAGFVDLMRVVYGNLLSLGLVLLAQSVTYLLPTEWFVHFKLSAIFLIFLLATLMMWATRVFVKTLYDAAFSDTRAMRILIYGAMQGGVGLAKSIRNQRPRKYIVKGFISHVKRGRHKEILGEPVYSVCEDLADIIHKKDIDAVLVSPYRVKDFRNDQKVQDQIIGAGAKILMAQNAVEMSDDAQQNGDENFDAGLQMREVSVEELLPRMEIRVDLKSVEELLKGKRVLITGSAGSIGSEMVNQVAKFKPAAMMLIDQAETPEHDIRLMMAKNYPKIPTETIVTSICNQPRMEAIFERFKPDYVFHAAAYKHVPMMENNPSEAVRNNIYGTKVIADLSVKYDVKKFVMVSTDKAVNPTNVMGCSKRICEIYVQSLDRKLKLEHLQTHHKLDRDYTKTQFVTTRFGNVLGSNGSVIPLFRKQIMEGGPVTVTDENIVRYFMLIPEACKLVLEAGTKGNGGEIFVFDMGQPVKISDLAKRMIKLSGAKNVEIKYTGLRPGEKLYEEVLNDQENTKPTFHEKIRIAEVREYDYDQVCQDIDELVEIAGRFDDMATVKKMKDIVPEYKSNNSVYEKLDKK
ncbi:nucleoside-diphosphate sugar epimerase/dehydratase [Prevotella sp. RM4]|uniref:nucleoside-diphosphate sugar epimerase/dehydratase n=1 Tax=Prevotella sp. RM4 TaxID=1200547 RepID=UPI00051C5198|nr:nucleoside-diphosphate sugar epimerase/dehydratase [Prevotella sp. RM4]